jgi:hypothetical protein
MGNSTSKPPQPQPQATGGADRNAALAGLAQLDAEIAQLDSMPSLPDELPDGPIEDMELPGDDELGDIDDADVELDEDTMLEVMQELEQLELEHQGVVGTEAPAQAAAEVPAPDAITPSTTTTQHSNAQPAEGQAAAVQDVQGVMQSGAAAVNQPEASASAAPASATVPDPDKDELDALRDEMAV